MAVRDIVVWPDDRLRQDSVEIDPAAPDTKELYRDLTDTMYASNGLGIAALQIGDSRRMFLVDAALAGKDKNAPPVAFLNPEVLSRSDDIEIADEGCLSFPGIYVPIERPYVATVKAQDLDGNWFEITGEGLLARCLLHEYDHLTGKLMVDFVGPLKKKMIKRKLARS